MCPIRSAANRSTVQPLAVAAWRERRSFREIVEAARSITAHLSREQIAEAFDPAFHMARVDEAFERGWLSSS